MQYLETHSLRKDAKFIGTSAEVSSRLKHGSLSNHSHLLAVFFRLKGGVWCRAARAVCSFTADDKTAALNNIHSVHFVHYERVEQKCANMLVFFTFLSRRGQRTNTRLVQGTPSGVDQVSTVLAGHIQQHNSEMQAGGASQTPPHESHVGRLFQQRGFFKIFCT